jgi:hypothetical protein
MTGGLCRFKRTLENKTVTIHHTARPRVDREDELALITRLVRGQTPARVALIQAPSGMGKSELLREFRARRPDHLPIVVIDFKGGGLTLADILFHVCDTLNQSHFPTLTHTVQHIVQPAAINVTRNLILGQNEISIALAAPDEQTRQQRRSQLTTALITDLRVLGRIILIFDTFEKCAPPLRAWLANVFLPAAHRSPQLPVIVAGQLIPEPTQMWDAETLLLDGIAPEHWHDYAHAVGAALTLEYIRGCCAALRGHCLAIANTIEIESQGGQRA